MSYGLHRAYDRLAKLGDPLAEIKTLLGLSKIWTDCRRIVKDNNMEGIGHHNIDLILMIKIP